MPGDLHCHTKLSDGSMGIDDLIILAKKQGITTIAITDHDCQAGNVRGKLIGERHGINVLPGVEISATDGESGDIVSVLCYLADTPDRLEGLCRRNLVARKKASQFTMLKAARFYPVAPELIVKCASGSTGVYRQHIMHALMECGLCDKIFGELYEQLFSPDDRHSILSVPQFPSPLEILDAIHESGGIAVVPNYVGRRYPAVLDSLVAAGVDGIEVWSTDCSPEEEKVLYKKALERGLMMTGGSNFHGMYGCVTVGQRALSDEYVSRLLSFKAQQRKQKAAAAAE